VVEHETDDGWLELISVADAGVETAQLEASGTMPPARRPARAVLSASTRRRMAWAAAAVGLLAAAIAAVEVTVGGGDRPLHEHAIAETREASREALPTVTVRLVAPVVPVVTDRRDARRRSAGTRVAVRHTTRVAGAEAAHPTLRSAPAAPMLAAHSVLPRAAVQRAQAPPAAAPQPTATATAASVTPPQTPPASAPTVVSQPPAAASSGPSCWPGDLGC
jgi:hypothetical protein